MSDASEPIRNAVACRTGWFWDRFEAADLPGEWLRISTPDELTVEALEAFDPTYIFFPHWSHIVPAAIYERWPCVCFHSAPVPYGRGGSPVQNMIVRGHESSELVALRMEAELDAGPVYLRYPLSLAGGGDEIFQRIASTSLAMMKELLETRPEPVAQEGEPTVFRRRKPADSRLPAEATLKQVFDHIRMLDAEGYPRAFVEVDGYRMTFSRAAMRRGQVEADVTIEKI